MLANGLKTKNDIKNIMLITCRERKSGNLFYIDGVLYRWQAQKLFSLNLFWSISIK